MLSRQQRRALERQEQKDMMLFQKLSAAEKQKILEYIDRKAEERQDRTWQIFSTYLCETMQENRVSQERQKKIFTETLAKVKDDAKVKIPDKVLLDKEDFSDWTELILEANCKGCAKSQSKCELAKLFRRCGIEGSSWNKPNCKYSYDEVKRVG